MPDTTIDRDLRNAGVVADIIDLAASHDDAEAVPTILGEAADMLRRIGTPTDDAPAPEGVTLRGLFVDIQGIAERRVAELQFDHTSASPQPMGIALVQCIVIGATRALELYDDRARAAAAAERTAKRLEERAIAAKRVKAEAAARAKARTASITKRLGK